MKSFHWQVRPTAARRPWLLLPAALLLAGCGGFGEAMEAHTDVVARAAGKELKVQDAAQLLASNPQLPPDPQVVQALADIWVDYTLLATAVAEDSSLSAVDIETFTLPAREQALVMKLREQVIQPDTVFEDAELEQLWLTEGPGAEVRARHILLRVPADATPEQRDSVQALAEELRTRAAGGEDFAALAAEHSQDPGSAQRGGDLGFFGRGRMVAPFEEAAFALEPGQVSQVVESPFGYHVIRVEERRQPELAEERDAFRQFLAQRAVQEAEGAYLDSLATAADVEIQPGGLAVVREIASRPATTLRGRAAERVIAGFEGGEFTSGEFVEFIRTQPPQIQSAFGTATDEQLEGVVQQLARKELLLAQAAERGIELTDAEQDSIRTAARSAVRELVAATGLQGAGRAGAVAVELQVRELLEAAINNEAQLVPLGRLGLMLRELYNAEINEGAFSQVVAQVEAERATSPAPAQGGLPQGMPPQGMPPQGMPPQGVQPQGMPPQGVQPQQPVQLPADTTP